MNTQLHSGDAKEHWLYLNTLTNFEQFSLIPEEEQVSRAVETDRVREYDIPKPKPEDLIRKAFARFTDQEIIPRAREMDEAGTFPRLMFEKLAKTGAFGMRYPKSLGGAGGNTTQFCVMVEEIARGSMSLAAITAMQCLMGTNFLYEYGTPDQHERLLKPAIRGEKVASFALAEANASTDLGGVKTTAKRVGDHWLINGSKTWITNAPVADFFIVLCQTDKTKKLKGLNFFLVERDTPGLHISKNFEKLGTRSTEISELAFTDMRIPLENMLGEEDRGVDNLMRILSIIRVMTGALSLGLARAAWDSSKRYAMERTQFGKKIGSFQLVQRKIANMATGIWASNLMVYRAAEMIDLGQRPLKEASMAKYFASEVACRAADEATRIFGAYGYSMEYDVQRFYRDCRFLLFGGGTSEILQTIISREYGVA
ncbi:MAG TPA: acyl-CoA dehydrogenase family protein [Desulfomonilaceae bacterium]|nr:acyl-CoA dehydrogenase family protein [Desulfomonilaceae bacterium]